MCQVIVGVCVILYVGIIYDMLVLPGSCPGSKRPSRRYDDRAKNHPRKVPDGVAELNELNARPWGI